MNPIQAKFILENEIERAQCNNCTALWIRYNHTKTEVGVYRLGPLPPEDCSICAVVDKEFEKITIMTFEEWVKSENVEGLR